MVGETHSSASLSRWKCKESSFGHLVSNDVTCDSFSINKLASKDANQDEGCGKAGTVSWLGVQNCQSPVVMNYHSQGCGGTITKLEC